MRTGKVGGENKNEEVLEQEKGAGRYLRQKGVNNLVFHAPRHFKINQLHCQG